MSTTHPTPHSIRLICVTENRKLRIRFNSYTDFEGKTYNGVYNNTYNCQFPKDIRFDGCLYEIGGDDLILVANGDKTPFYRVRKDSIRVLGAAMISIASSITPPENVYEVTECVICMENTPAIIFIPCAHVCCCIECWSHLKSSQSSNTKCPLCRTKISNVIANS